MAEGAYYEALTVRDSSLSAWGAKLSEPWWSRMPPKPATAARLVETVEVGTGEADGLALIEGSSHA
jgi:hypothetical protein